MDPKYKKVLEAWDTEIEAEEEGERELVRQARSDQRKLRASEQKELAKFSAKLLSAAGITEADARQQADDAFERAKKAAAAARKRALKVVKQRARANAAEVKNLLSVRRGT